MTDYGRLGALHPFAIVWRNMHARCYNPQNNRYKTYGGRGIAVEGSWHVFANFYTDMWDAWQPGLQLDRIDNNGNYGKENCRWVSALENSRKRTNTKLTKEQAEEIQKSRPKTMQEQCALAKQFGVSTRMIRYIRDGKAWT